PPPGGSLPFRDPGRSAAIGTPAIGALRIGTDPPILRRPAEARCPGVKAEVTAGSASDDRSTDQRDRRGGGTGGRVRYRAGAGHSAGSIGPPASRHPTRASQVRAGTTGSGPGGG